jgi:hypothetical protein
MESSLTDAERSHMHNTLDHLKKCRGRNCILPKSNRGNQIGSQGSDNSVVSPRGNSRKKNNFIGN